MAAESRLLEEPGYEFMVLDLVDVLLPQGTFPSKPICDVRGGRLVQTYISHVPLKTKRYNATALRCCLGVVFSPFRRAALNVAAEECGAAVFTGDTVLAVSEGFPCLSTPLGCSTDRGARGQASYIEKDCFLSVPSK